MSGTLATKSVHGVFWSFVEKFSVQGIQFLTGLILARLLSPTEFGLIGMILVFMAISQTFVDFGFTNALIQKKDRTETDYSTAFLTNIAISFFVYGLLYVGAPYIARFYRTGELVLLTRVISLNIIFYALLSIYKTRLTINLDFKTQATASLTAVVISGVAGVIMALRGYGVWAIVVQSLSNTLLTFLLLLAITRWRPSMVFSKESFRPMFSFGSRLLAASLISTVYSNLYALVIGKRYASYDLGLYTRADQFVKFPSVNLAGIISRVSFPVLSSIQDDPERLSRIYMKYLRMVSYVVFPLMILMAVLSDPVIRIVLTDKWIEASVLIKILCLAYIWDPISMISLNVLYVKGRSDIVLKLEILKKTIAVAILAVTFSFGMQIMCVGIAVYSLIAVFINSFVSGRFLDNNWALQVKDIFSYFLLAAVMGGVVYLTQSIFVNDWLKVVSGTIAGAGFYIVISHLMHLEPFRDIIFLLRQKFPRKK